MKCNVLVVGLCLANATTAFAAKGAKPDAAAAAPQAPTAARSGGCKQPARSTCAPNNVVFGSPMLTPFTQNAGDAPALAAADVNNDGKTDLLVSHTNGSIDVMLSTGAGSFELAKKLSVRVAGMGMVAADFDGDCNADIIASSAGTRSVGNSVDLLRGKGDGGFRVPENFDIAVTNVVKMQAADVSGDRRLDIAYEGNNGGTDSFNYGTANGKLSSPVSFNHQDAWILGDVTGDGVAEIIGLDTHRSNPVPMMCVSANNGRGQFDDQKCYQGEANLTAKGAGFGDLNGDGKNDVVIFGNTNDYTFYVYMNLGGGKFDDRETYPAHYGQAFVMADANNDGKADLVVYSANESDGGLFIYKSKGKSDGSVDAKADHYPLGASSPRSEEVLVTGDFSGNGLVGFATIDRGKDAVSVLTAECRN